MTDITPEWLTETAALFDKYIEAHAAEGQVIAMLKGQLVKLLANAAGESTAPAVPISTAAPTLSGTAEVGQTLTCSGGTWTGLGSNPIYQHQWQEAVGPLFNQWTDIPGATADTYVATSGQIDKQMRCGKRASADNGVTWSLWSYTQPSGIVVASAPPGSPPTINTAGYFTGPGGSAIPSPLSVGDVLEIHAADIDGETGSWYFLERDGMLVGSQPVASDQDTFPKSYTVTGEDVTTTFRLQTVATNATPPQQTAFSADIGPIGYPPSSGTLIDLGSLAATEQFIRDNAPAEWVPSGSPTLQLTANNVGELKTHLATAKAGALTGRYEITCNWDGISFTGSETATILSIQGPGGTNGWADNNGWLKIKAAPGTRPAIGNRVTMNNCRGLEVDGVDFAGKYSGSGQTNQQYTLWIQRNGSFNAPGKITLKNLGVGRYFRDNTYPSGQFINSVAIGGGLCDQLVLDNVMVHGSDLGIKGQIRLFVSRHSDHTMPKQDFIGMREHSGSGYYAYVIVEYSTIRENLTDYIYRTNHKDMIQTGRTPKDALGDYHLGYRLILKGLIGHAEHYYAGTSSAGGGSQGSYNDDYFTADNLYAISDCIILCTTVHAFAFFTPGATMVSYMQNCTLGRAGRVASQFSPDTGTPTDYSPGVTHGTDVQTPGIALKIIDSLIGAKYDASRGYFASNVQLINTTVVNYTKTPYTTIPNVGIAASDPRPEDVFNGTTFTRGGAAEANSIANKFGYLLPNEGTVSGFLSDIAANFTPQGAYASRGAPAPNPANYCTLTVPAGGG